MRLKKFILNQLVFAFLAFGVLSFGLPANAAPQEFRRDKVKALKVAFITNRLALTSQEAQGFWPVYNELAQKRQAISQQRRALLRQAHDGYFSITDADMEKLIQQGFELRQQELDLEKHYYDLLKPVLPVKKIALLYKVEKDFNAEVLKQAISRTEE